MNAVVDFARSDLGAERLRVMIALFNRRAQRVCVLAGLVLDQTFLRQRDGVHFVVLMRDIEVRPQSNAWTGVTREGRQCREIGVDGGSPFQLFTANLLYRDMGVDWRASNLLHTTGLCD